VTRTAGRPSCYRCDYTVKKYGHAICWLALKRFREVMKVDRTWACDEFLQNKDLPAVKNSKGASNEKS